MKSFKQFRLEEAVRFDTDSYVNSHGKKPKGTGSWMFASKTGKVDHKDETEVFSPKGSISFMDAKKQAKVWAKKQKLDVVYVMESLDEAKPSLFDAAIKRAQTAHKKQLKLAVAWLKKTSGKGEEALKKFDLLRGDLEFLKQQELAESIDESVFDEYVESIKHS